MKMKKLFFTVTVLIIGSSLYAQQKAYTLKQCVETAVANNLQVKQSGLDKDAAEVNYRQAKNNRLPDVSGNYGFGINNGRSIDPFTNGYINQQLNSSNTSLSMNIPVFSGLRLQNSIKQREYGLKAAEMDWQQQKDNLTLNVILAYLQVLNSEDLLTLAKQQATVTARQVERLETLNKEGAISPADLSDMKGQYASDEINIMSAKGSLEAAKLNLSILMNIPYSDAMELERDAAATSLTRPELTAEGVYQTSLTQLAGIKANDFRTQSAAAAVKVAGADHYPQLSLFGQVGTNYSSAASRNIFLNTQEVPSGDYVTVAGNKLPVITQQSNFRSEKISYGSQYKNNLGTYAGINLRVPIFAAFQTHSNVKLAKIQQKNVALQADNAKWQLRQLVEQAHLNWVQSYDKFQLLAKQVAAFEESYRAAEIRFTEGAWNSVQYLIVKNNYDRSRANWITTGYEYQLRTRILDFYQGKQNW